MSIPTIKENVLIRSLSLYPKLFLVDSPLQTINSFFLTEYCTKQILYAGTLIERIVNMGFSPIKCAFTKAKYNFEYETKCDGIVDSLRSLIFTKDFVNPKSTDFLTTVLLTKAF